MREKREQPIPERLEVELEYVPLWIMYVLGGTPVWWIVCSVFG